jgi:hypothetical protein
MQWLPLAITHPAMMQSSIAMGAIHRLLLEGKPIGIILGSLSGEYMTQKMKAIQMVNSSLSDSKEAISDVNICAVAMLAGCEVSSPFLNDSLKILEFYTRTHSVPTPLLMLRIFSREMCLTIVIAC